MICSLHSQITLRQSSGEPHQTTPRMVSARAKRGRIEPHERLLDDSLFNVRGLVENAITLQDSYDVVSNRESGYGRYDIMLMPKDVTKRGIVIEFKRTEKKESLETAAAKALEQIKSKQYDQELKKRGIKTITYFGIAFKGKEVLLQQE
jgi:PD-(D/E)XK nuclease superfamily protein